MTTDDGDASLQVGDVQYRHVPRFQAGDPLGLAYLEEHGYLVVADALSAREAETALDKTWDYLEGLGTGIDRRDPATWDDDRWPTAVHGGILPGHGIGHCDAQWFIRSVPNVKAAFAAIWGTDDLLVSFDGMALWRPFTLNEKWRTNRGTSWLHIDQHPIGRPGKHCVQGLVNLIATSPQTGGNVLIPGSHRDHHRIPERYPERLSRIHPSIDHFRYPANDPILASTPPIMCHLEAGDMLLWDSRTIHCSSPALQQPEPKAELLRAVGLVCMMPRSKSNAHIISVRKEAVAKRTSTTNWSDVFVNADEFPQILAVADRHKFQWPPVPELDEYQLLLVGWTRDELSRTDAG